jgi:hypothetical protein
MTDKITATAMPAKGRISERFSDAATGVQAAADGKPEAGAGGMNRLKSPEILAYFGLVSPWEHRNGLLLLRD